MRILLGQKENLKKSSIDVLLSELGFFPKHSERDLDKSHYIILNNGILKSKSSIFPQSNEYITQYTL